MSRTRLGANPGRRNGKLNELDKQAQSLTPAGHSTLSRIAPCIILDCAAVCAKCGIVASPGHCITTAHGFRCASCCEAPTHKTANPIEPPPMPMELAMLTHGARQQRRP